MNISDLTSDLLSEIFRYLHPHEWFCAEFVCKRWATILRGFWDQVKEVEYESYGYIRLIFNDRQIYRLNCSSGLWTDDNYLLAVVLKRCGSKLHKLIMHIPEDMMMMPVKPETILSIGVHCKELRALNLNGHVSPVADCVSVTCHDLLNLEEFYIWDESFPQDTKGDVNAGDLVGDIISTCSQLRSLEVNFLFIPPPSEDACRRLSHLKNIRRLRWLFWSPLPPEFVENFFHSIIDCRRTLRELSFSCKVKAPVNGGRCAEYLRQLAKSDDRLEVLDLGFQLQEASREESSDELYYDPVESAPWTKEFLSALDSFHNLSDLSLRYFDLDDDAVVESLKHAGENLQVFRLEDNYSVNGKLTWALRTHLKKLRAISISQAWLSHADMVEFILECPKLEMVRFSNVEPMSFKRLVLETHAALHRCGGWTKSCNVTNQLPLNLKLDTARGYIHEEAEQLKNVHLCGLTLAPPSHSNVFIDRVCKKSPKVILDQKIID